MNERLWCFEGGRSGQFIVDSVMAARGESLPLTPRLSVTRGGSACENPAFRLKGVLSNERYVTRNERNQLTAKQQEMGRPESAQGALIPIRKSPEWWGLPQDERRQILEEQSAHIKLGLGALPQVARRLHHCRDLEQPEPFDFITWFDFSPGERPIFDDLLGVLRTTEEWQYVEREVEIRVTRDTTTGP